MPKDYAKPSRGSRETKRSRTPPKRKTPSSRATRRGFSPGSFGAGVAVGVAAVLIVINGLGIPDPDQNNEQTAEAPVAAPPPKFEFFDRLPKSELTPDTRPYETEADTDADVPREYLLQAGSFRDRDDAERLRANLLLDGMKAATTEAALGQNGTWYRVLVGPFKTRLETQRAMTRLREQNISALLLKRASTAG